MVKGTEVEAQHCSARELCAGAVSAPLRADEEPSGMNLPSSTSVVPAGPQHLLHGGWGVR